MEILRIGITQTEEEWNKLDDAIRAKNAKSGDNAHKNITNHITMEISKLFKNYALQDCPETKIVPVKKDFSICTDSETIDKVRCMARTCGIGPSQLIARLVIDPHLYK